MSENPPSGIDAAARRMISHTEVPAGGRWSARLARGETLRIVDLKGIQAVDFLCFAGEDPHDRYNAGNTIKMQGSIYIAKGSVLYSDHARALMKVTADSCGFHDTIAGCCSTPMNRVRYGVKDTPSCRTNFTTELARWGLGEADVVANVNFFMYVPVTSEGSADIKPGLSKPGDFVEAKALTDVIAVISNCPQRFNPCNGFEPTPVEVTVLG